VWFGKNSTQTKYQRLLQDLTLHMYPTTWSDKHVVRLDYLPVLRLCLTEPLLRDGVNGIDRVIDIMDAYSLTREQREILIELDELSDSTEGSELRSIQKLIPTQVKTALTRRYNQKKHTTTPLSTTTLKKKSRRRSDVVTQAISNEDEVAALMDEEEEKDQDQDQEEKEGEEERESAQQQNEQNAAKSALALDALVTVGRSETKTKTQIKTTSDRSKKTKHN
jgi:replication factor C subunit 1